MPGHAGRSRHGDVISGPQLVELLPQQERDADHLDEAKHRMILGPGELKALAGPNPQRRMFARMEDFGGTNGAAETIEHVEIDLALAVWLHSRGEIVDAHGAPRQLHPRLASDAIAHRRRRVVVDRAEVALA